MPDWVSLRRGVQISKKLAAACLENGIAAMSAVSRSFSITMKCDSQPDGRGW